MTFPILQQRVHNKRLAYLDSAASTQKPKEVIETVKEYYETTNSNVHRGIHALSEKATEQLENSRKTIAEFFNARKEEIIFTSGTTESINMLATIINLQDGDEVILTEMEHHANLVPWQQTKATLKFIPVKEDGTLDLEEYEKLITEKTKVVSVTHISNVLGTINPIKEIIAKAKNAITIIDGAQAAGHEKIDVKELGCDFYACSAHKMYGPTGVGILYGKTEQLNKLTPYKFGGEMIHEVTLEKSTFTSPPHKFEAGTPNIAGIIGTGKAVEWLQKQKNNEEEITTYAYNKLKEIKGLTILGPQKRGALIAFTLKGIHAHDVAAICDQEGVAVRAGHHCAMPLATKLGIQASTRASLGLYTTKEDIDQLITALKKAQEIFA